jgi:1-acyl-sn-glycerol-3-phosphate acyltransferase
VSRPDLIAAGEGRLGFVERQVIRFTRRTFEPGWVDGLMRFLQRHVGAAWIVFCTKRLLQVHGVDRLPEFDPKKSYIVVSNHRSFFDLYVITGFMLRRRMPHRIIFPVRSNFFYDRFLGLLVNGVMSWFSMYPPIFRSREKIRLNVTSLKELAWMLNRGGYFCGFHPEGTRGTGDDPYTLLPPQRGIGQVIHGCEAEIIPMFINGLSNDLPRQVKGNFDGTGRPIVVVLGEPIDFEDLRAAKGSIKTHAAIAERTIEHITRLGTEERELRAQLEP